MLPVKVTLTMGKKQVSVDDVRDARIANPMKAAGRDVGTRLAGLKCPVHQKTASNVRIHFDARGAADLQYDSCCAELGTVIGKALG